MLEWSRSVIQPKWQSIQLIIINQKTHMNGWLPVNHQGQVIIPGTLGECQIDREVREKDKESVISLTPRGDPSWTRCTWTILSYRDWSSRHREMVTVVTEILATTVAKKDSWGKQLIQEPVIDPGEVDCMVWCSYIYTGGWVFCCNISCTMDWKYFGFRLELVLCWNKLSVTQLLY